MFYKYETDIIKQKIEGDKRKNEKGENSRNTKRNRKEKIKETIKRAEKKRNNTGITLVSLVVTIIILIILAGVSINLTLGEEGIFTMAKRAKENTELAQIEEKEKLNTLYTQLELNSEGEGSGGTSYEAIEKLLEFKKAIAEAIKTAGGKETDYNAETSTFEENIKGIVAEATKNANATEADLLLGKTAWVNGNQITGSGLMLPETISFSVSCCGGGDAANSAGYFNGFDISGYTTMTVTANRASGNVWVSCDGVVVQNGDCTNKTIDVTNYSSLSIHLNPRYTYTGSCSITLTK